MTALTPDQVAAFMSSATSAEDWDNKCDLVKEAFGGDYPSFWFQTILQSGVAKRTLAKFGETDELTIHLEADVHPHNW